ncbi:hypothetical protein PILCRDRAFT_568250 [Piloderma croceum F 1598]|uniref:Uncharacterized protein n=1 Tax=Piloderma croceum (strain F 1598) TaxID=765440 RepID=A0A0C3BPC3_PILCF|nr:hypothetical protein PILCRDRAFT_568250 [Piloderma croceum F 1598]
MDNRLTRFLDWKTVTHTVCVRAALPVMIHIFISHHYSYKDCRFIYEISTQYMRIR